MTHENVATPPATPTALPNRDTETRMTRPGLPTVDEFLSLVEDEDRSTAHNLSGYSVYHKYNKSC